MLAPTGATQDGPLDAFLHDRDFSVAVYEGALFVPAHYDDAGLQLWRVRPAD